MGLGTNQVTLAVANNFIPELWSDEVIATYKQKLVLGNLVTKISFKGKKPLIVASEFLIDGDTSHISHAPTAVVETATKAMAIIKVISIFHIIVDIIPMTTTRTAESIRET